MGLSFIVFSLPLLSMILTIFTLSLTIYFSKSKSKSNNKTNNVPPGSFGWPFIGETYEFLHGKPEKFFGDRMKKHSNKIFKTKIFGEPTVVFCGNAGNKFMSANENVLFQGCRPICQQKLFRSSYQKLPSVLVPRTVETHYLKAPGFLRPQALVRYMEKMDSIVQQHINMYWEGNQVVKVYDLAQVMTTTLSSHFFLGIDDQDRVAKLARLLTGLSKGLHSMPINFPGTIFHRAKKSADIIREEILLIIKEKKDKMSSGIQMHDILSHMILNRDPEGRFSPENEIADKAMGFLISGFSTPASALSFIMKFIGERPDVYGKIRSEQLEIRRSKTSSEALDWNDIHKMKYTWNIALEVMRLIPPFQGTFREAITDFTYEGFNIPRGWKLYWAVNTTNKNSEYFPEPDNFVPTRFEQENFPPPYTNIPFGGGPRICPGKDYVRIVLLTFLHNIVMRFKWEVMIPSEKIIGSLVPEPTQGLPVRLQPQLP